MHLLLAPSRVVRRCRSWGTVLTSIGSVAAVAGAIVVGVLQAGHQGECIGAAHYRAECSYQVQLQVAAAGW